VDLCGESGVLAEPETQFAVKLVQRMRVAALADLLVQAGALSYLREDAQGSEHGAFGTLGYLIGGEDRIRLGAHVYNTTPGDHNV